MDRLVPDGRKEFPCDGIIAVNDKAASNPVLKNAYKAASGKKTFVWTVEDFIKKSPKVLASDTQYFVITKIQSIWKKFWLKRALNQV